MNGSEHRVAIAKGGSVWKGIGVASLCQVAYLLFVFELDSDDTRVLGYMLFGLVQFIYLFPLAIFYHKRNEGLTSNGVIILGALSLVGAAVWFGYAAMHGTLPTVNV
jgi:hypothetical protein